eukprot:COSAG01_NODE_6940_length_3430_cov_2.386971_6_plen_67_part_00
MQLLHAILFATVHAATTVAGAGVVGAGAPADTYCVVDGESGAESCDTCPQCDAEPGDVGCSEEALW